MNGEVGSEGADNMGGYKGGRRIVEHGVGLARGQRSELGWQGEGGGVIRGKEREGKTIQNWRTEQAGWVTRAAAGKGKEKWVRGRTGQIVHKGRQKGSDRVVIWEEHRGVGGGRGQVGLKIECQRVREA